MILGPQSLGEQRYYDFQLTAGDGSSLAAVFTGAETISAELWPGDDQAAVATLTAAWAPTAKYASNPAIAQPWVRVTVTPTAIAGLPPGKWPMRGLISPSTDKIAYIPLDTVLELTAIPAGGVALKSYISAQYLRNVCPALERVQNLKSDQAGFAEHRAMSREWFQKLLHNVSPVGVIGDHLAGWVTPSYPGRSTWLQEQLDNELLIVTDEIQRCVAYHTAGNILIQQLGASGDTAMQDLGAWYLHQADSLAKQIIAEIDTGGVTGTTTGTPTTTSIPLTGDDISAVDDYYNGWYLKITSGLLAGEERLVSDYVGATATATVAAFNAAPAASVSATLYEREGKYSLDLSRMRVRWG